MSGNLRAYKTAIHHAAVSVSRRPPPDTINHPSVGTVKQSRAAHERVEKEKASRPTRSRVQGYCMSIQDMIDWGYPDPSNDALTQGGGEEPDAQGTTQTCSRCKVQFIVSTENLDTRLGECRYHYGRMAPERVEGRRQWIYSCCGKERGEAGCEDGVHVFTDGDRDEALARRRGFRTVRQVVGEGEGEGEGRAWSDVVAMDCEMICECILQWRPNDICRHHRGICTSKGDRGG